MTDFSFQLYSARNFPPLSDTLRMLKSLGYASVEGFGGLYSDAADLKAALDETGLTMPTGHFGLDQLKDTDTTIPLAQSLGVKTLFCPAVPRELWEQPEEAWEKLAELLASLSRTYTREGFGFGWHNHHFEFWPTASGKLPIDILLSGAPEIAWEMDVAWVVRGNNDPLTWIEKFGDRISAVHVKDLAPEGENTDEDGWADVGHGVLRWKELMDVIRDKTQARYFVMEHDNPSDLERFARRSIEAARAL